MAVICLSFHYTRQSSCCNSSIDEAHAHCAAQPVWVTSFAQPWHCHVRRYAATLSSSCISPEFAELLDGQPVAVQPIWRSLEIAEQVFDLCSSNLLMPLGLQSRYAYAKAYVDSCQYLPDVLGGASDLPDLKYKTASQTCKCWFSRAT